MNSMQFLGKYTRCWQLTGSATAWKGTFLPSFANSIRKNRSTTKKQTTNKKNSVGVFGFHKMRSFSLLVHESILRSEVYQVVKFNVTIRPLLNLHSESSPMTVNFSLKKKKICLLHSCRMTLHRWNQLITGSLRGFYQLCWQACLCGSSNLQDPGLEIRVIRY